MEGTFLSIYSVIELLVKLLSTISPMGVLGVLYEILIFNFAKRSLELIAMYSTTNAFLSSEI